MKLEGEKVNDVYIEYLDLRLKRNFSSDLLEDAGVPLNEERLTEIKKNFTLIILVDNYGSGQAQKVNYINFRLYM